MGWKQLEFKERWSLAMSTLQAGSTFLLLVIGFVGIWKVTPIITYQVQQQESDLAQIVSTPSTSPLVVDALNWWSGEMRGYRRVVALIREAERAGRDVSFEVVTDGGDAIARGVNPDLLVVTAVNSAGQQETVSVPVNENAMSPSQYVRFHVNQGAFADLAEDARRNVDIAVERYINRVMVPTVPPIIVHSTMTVEELRLEVALNEHHREEALRHIKGLEEVLAAAQRSQ